MAQYYNSIKTMKTARVGTIIPWGGDGQEGFTAANIPKGWKVCDGKELDAVDYPLLVSEIGNTYGGTITGDFPSYGGTFVLPNITNRAMIDLEKSYLGDPKYQFGQNDANTVIGDLVKDFGTTSVIPTLISANADIDFVFTDPNVQLTGKFTGQTISDPDFFATISTLNRKLGMNHTPAHQHPGSFDSARAGFFGPEVFTSTNVVTGGVSPHPNCGHQVKSQPNECSFDPDQSAVPAWNNGRAMMAYYASEEYEDSMPTMDKFHEYINDTGKDYWSTVPAASWHDGTPTRNSPQATTQTVDFVGSTYTDAFPYSPAENDPTNTDKPLHYNNAWAGLFPRPQVFANRRNYYGTDTGSNLNNVIDNPEDPINKFTVTGVSVTGGEKKFKLPPGTDIRTTKTQGTGAQAQTWYQYDKIRPFKMVDGDPFAKGAYIVGIERTGNDDTDYEYEIEMNVPSENTGTDVFDVTFQEGTYGTTLNTFGTNNPNDTTFTSHSHGTFDIQMSVGSMKPETTYPITNISLGSVTPENFDNALNIVVDIAQPSMVVVYLIKAF